MSKRSRSSLGSTPITCWSVMHWALTPRGMPCPQGKKTTGTFRPLEHGLKPRGRGKKRFETVSALRQAVVAIVQRYSVENLIWFRLTQHDPPHPVRAYRGQPARVDHDRHATVEVRVDEAAL